MLRVYIDRVGFAVDMFIYPSWCKSNMLYNPANCITKYSLELEMFGVVFVLQASPITVEEQESPFEKQARLKNQVGFYAKKECNE